MFILILTRLVFLAISALLTLAQFQLLLQVDTTEDWFNAISSAFGFNERIAQKPLNGEAVGGADKETN